MKFYYTDNLSTEHRRRFNKDYIQPGDIVVYKRTDIIRNVYWVTDSRVEIGLMKFEYGDKLDGSYSIYEATEEEKTAAIGQELLDSYLRFRRVTDGDLLSYVIELIEGGNIPSHEIMDQLFSIVFLDNYSELDSFRRDVYAKCKDKTGAIGLNFNRQKSELYSVLMGVAMILGCDKDRCDKQEMAILMKRHWHQFAIIYSLFYGRNIVTDHRHFVELLSSLVHNGKTNDDVYLHLMLIALGDVDTKVKKIMKYSPTENEEQLRGYIATMKRQRDLVEQSTELDELFGILFPKTYREYLSQDNPYASFDEMQDDLHKSKEAASIMKKLEDYARVLETQLGNAIKMEDLKSAILQCEPSVSRAIFAQLDMVLEGNNEVWDRNRKELKKEITRRYTESVRLLNNTRDTAQLAADYARQAAERPQTLQIAENYASITIENQNNYEGAVPPSDIQLIE